MDQPKVLNWSDNEPLIPETSFRYDKSQKRRRQYHNYELVSEEEADAIVKQLKAEKHQLISKHAHKDDNENILGYRVYYWAPPK